ncbi:hypothetical protein KCTC52924_00730 [Arenibacter antarcticus]|uniref:Outer membrane protein beta-barrel domain-containing protein n=1 Tax=Arenibacter antarcticus TaxID=2040469 RepID=A0ABW5VBY2_9FLAO|nr:hypothetical protein [Arenibacter sp. H213]MCM4169208.1 hypothetical protein [Arenibacter sp. H213]
MKEYLVYLFFVMFSLSGVSQEFIEKSGIELKSSQRLSFSGLSYPEGVNGEVFKNLKIDYKISERLMVQLQHFYEKFGSHEETNSSFLAKWKVKKNLHFYVGPESKFQIKQVTGEHELMRVNLNVGLGYEVNPSLLLELGYPIHTNKAALETFGNRAKPAKFSLRAKF